MRFLITGTAGFIGFHLARRLLDDGHQVTGVDGLTPYYDVRLKIERHGLLKARNGFTEEVLMLEDSAALAKAAQRCAPEVIVHLAAQAGVRYSFENPRAYVDANLVGTFNLLEVARTAGVRHLLAASTSSVYGANIAMPFREIDRTDHPLTVYAATKKAGEEMAHAYSHLWALPTTLFRFFTVYGPWGRPDMALYRFAQGIAEGRPIDVYNHGRMQRDFTFIDDLIEAIVRLVPTAPVAGEPVAGGIDSLSPVAPWRVVNIGRGAPTALMEYIAAIEAAMGRAARLNLLPIQPGEVTATWADTSLLATLTGYRPATEIGVGVAAFCDWFLHWRAQVR